MGSQVTIEFDINPKQERFLLAQTKYIAYGGSRGGGKSWVVRKKANLLCCRYSNFRVLLLRRTFSELEKNHIRPLRIELKRIAHYKEAKKIFQYPNGSYIELGYCKNEADVYQYQGAEYDVIFLEEATLFTEAQLIFIITCLRTTRLDFSPRVYYTCNPGGVGHYYVKRLFIDKEYEGNEDPDDYTFIPASIYDNKVLMKNDPTYIKVLDNLPEELRRAHRDGDWDALVGTYFKEFRRATHVIEPFNIPKEWRRYVTIDYGLDCLAAYWIAVDYEGYCYVYREVWEKNLIVSQAANLILHHSKGERIENYYMPPDMKVRHKDTGRTTLQLFLEYGIVGVIAKNDRLDGWLCMKEMLRSYGKSGCIRLRFFNTCTKVIKHIPQLQRSDKDPRDVAEEPHEITHGPDAIRYFSSTWITVPVVEQDEIKGTYFLAELRMKGYSMAKIRELERKGNIVVIN
jgi:phage terminase large subunit